MLNNQATDNSILKVDQVSWRRSDRKILQEISWQVKQGENWAIIGLNGSGKTSLLNMITGYEWPTSGSIYAFGQKYGTVDLQELRKRIAWVSLALKERYHHRAGSTAIEVVISGKYATIGLYQQPTEEEYATAYSYLQKFHAEQIADKAFFTLSEGEKQKVILARAWMSNAEIIILDEPCNGLDIRAREELLRTIDLLGQDQEGPTLIYVTHRTEEIMPTFTHALLLKEGKVIAQGPKENMFTQELLEETLQIPLQLSWQNERLYLSGR